MFKHHLKTALRNILHRKLYSFVAASSLAIGLTVSILILAFVRFESSFDAMHFDSERTYRLNWITGGGSHFATFMNPLSPVLTSALPEIESFTRLAINDHLITVGGQDQYRNIAMVDETFFDFFNYEEVAGDPASAIADVSSAVITVAAAEQLFGTAEAMGRTFEVDGQYNFQVAAIVANNPGNSHLTSNIYVNNENLPAIWNYQAVWDNMGSDVMYHYVKLAPGVDPERAAENALAFYRDNIQPETTLDIVLQPLRDIHFTTDLQNEMGTRDDISNVVKPLRQRSDILVFSGVALLTLFIAAINFMNLQAVQLTRRTREIGIRRISGSSNSELVIQFLIETGVISLVAFSLALLLSELLFPLFSNLVAASMNSETFLTPGNVGLLAASAVVVGVLAGAYPAITATRMTSSSALRGEVIRGVDKQRFRSLLIIAQFSISIGLIIASGVVNTQINYAMKKSLGFDPAGVVTVNLPNNATRQAYDVMRDRLLAEPGIVSVSAGSVIPTRDLSDGSSMVREGGDPNEPLVARMVFVGQDYFSTLGMNLIAGRALTEDVATDQLATTTTPTSMTRIGAVVLNETAVRDAGFASAQEAIGQALYTEGQFQGRSFRSDYQVVGVVEDAHFQSIRADIAPITFFMANARNVMIVKLAQGNQLAALQAIDRVWAELVPDFPIQRDFLADSYSAFYAGESRTFSLFIGLSVVAIVIACLGLYALASFNAERRTREISIRKVLGATVSSIAGMLAWDFSRLLILANLIAWPLAWWSMNQWLANFAYRTDINIGIFLLAGIATFIIALATTFQRAYSVATRNPVHSLRTE